MKYFRFFMADGDDAGGNMGGEAAPASDVPAPAPAAPEAPAPVDMHDEPETGSVTPEDVAEILHLPKQEVATEEEDNEQPDAEPENAEADAGQLDSDQPDDARGPAKAEPVSPADAKPAEAPAAETLDFSFTVEGADGNSYKINPDETMEEVLAKWEPKNNGQIIDVLEQLREAKSAQKDYQASQATAQEEAQRTERITAIQEGWTNEAKALVAAGRLENSADPMQSDRVKQVFSYMKEENDKRAADGRPQIASLEDAFDKLELREQREAAAADKENARTRARENGSLVGGRSAPAAGTGAAYVAGSARTADQALRQSGLLR